MTTMFIEKINLKDLEETLANSTALLAVIGAGDFAVEKLRAARDELAGRAGAIDPKTLRDQAQSTISGRVETLQSGMMTAPDQLKALPDKAQELPTWAQSLLADMVSTAFATYGDFAGRGKSRMTQIRRNVPAEIQVEVDVTPLSRPASSSARTTTAKKPATRKPAAKKSTTSTGTATKPARKRTPTKRTTAKKSTSTSASSTSNSSSSSKS